MTRIRIHLLPLLLLLLLLNSCSEETTLTGLAGAGDGTVSIPYTVDATVAESRAVPALSHECVLSDAVIMFFAPEDEGGALTAYVIPTVKANGTLTFSMPKDLASGKHYDVLAAGNLENFIPANRPSKIDTWIETMVNDGLTCEEVMRSMTVGCKTPIVKDNPGALPMWGEMIDASGRPIDFYYTMAADEVNYELTGSFKFYRACVRIDVQNLVPQQIDLRYVRVWNYRDQGYLYQDGMYAGNIVGMADTPTSVGSDGVPEGYTPISQTVTDGKQMLKATLYCFPNVCSRSIPNDRLTTCLIFAGYHPEKPDQLTWYRFNITNFEDAQSFKRNHVYRATICGVKELGKDDDKQAYEYTMPVFEYEIDEEWDDDGDNSQVDADGNFIMLSRNRITFSGSTANFVTTDTEIDKDDTSVTETSTITTKAERIQVRVNAGCDWEWVCLGDENSDYKADEADFDITIDKTDNSIIVTPNKVNDESRVKHAYYAVRHSKNPSLQVRVYVEQNSTKDDVVELTANGIAEFYSYNVNGNGENVSIYIRTGNAYCEWFIDNFTELQEWDPNITTDNCTTQGGDGGYLKLDIPAYLPMDTDNSAPNPRTIDLQLKHRYQNAQGQEIECEPLTIRLSQEKSKNMISVYPRNVNGQPIRINCFDAAGEFVINSYVKPQTFSVTLGHPDYRYIVTSTFDHTRDLVISDESILDVSTSMNIQSSAMLIAAHDDIYFGRYRTQSNNTNSSVNTYIVNNNLNRLTQPTVKSTNSSQNGMNTGNPVGLTSGKVFYAFPFKMGPGDEPITNQITVHAVHKDDVANYIENLDKVEGEKLPIDNVTQTYSVTLQLYVPDVIIDDVIIKIPENIYNFHPNDYGDYRYVMIADRYVGSPSRVNGYNDKQIAYNFNWWSQIKINGYPESQGKYGENTLFSSPTIVKSASTYSDGMDLALKSWCSNQLDNNQLYSPFYAMDNISKWGFWINDDVYLQSSAFTKFFQNIVQYSKLRAYIVSDIKSPDGKYVCCYLPFVKNVANHNESSINSGSTYNSFLYGADTNIMVGSPSRVLQINFLHSGSVSNNTSWDCVLRPFRFLTQRQVDAYSKVYPRNEGDPYLGPPIDVSDPTIDEPDPAE